MAQHATPKKNAFPRPGGAPVKPAVPVPAVRRTTSIPPVPMPHTPAAARPTGIQASLRAPAPRTSSPSAASAHLRAQARVPPPTTAANIARTAKVGAAAFPRPAAGTAIQRLPYTDLERTPGYVQWNEGGSTWHINYALGDKKSGREVFHVTKEGNPKIHYFFSKDDDGDYRDEVGTGRKETRKKFSNLPQNIQATVKALF